MSYYHLRQRSFHDVSFETVKLLAHEIRLQTIRFLWSLYVPTSGHLVATTSNMGVADFHDSGGRDDSGWHGRGNDPGSSDNAGNVTAERGFGKQKRDRSKDRKTVQLFMDQDTYDNIEALVEEIDAASVAELIRRALQAREIFYPAEDAAAAKVTVLEQDGIEDTFDRVRRLNVPVTSKTRGRLERLKQATGKSYVTLVREAVIVFAQLVENQKEYLAGDGNNDEGGSIAALFATK